MWPFVFLLIVLALSVLLAMAELAADVWVVKKERGRKTDQDPAAGVGWPGKKVKGEGKGAEFVRRLKFALFGCCTRPDKKEEEGKVRLAPWDHLHSRTTQTGHIYSPQVGRA